MSKLKTTDDLEKAKKYFLKLKKGETIFSLVKIH